MIPEVGQWYKRKDDEEEFEIVSCDEDEGIVEVQYSDGTVEALDSEDWEADRENGLLELTTAPGLEEEDDEEDDDYYEDEEEEE